eukprot:EG_transcript_18008
MGTQYVVPCSSGLRPLLKPSNGLRPNRPSGQPGKPIQPNPPRIPRPPLRPLALWAVSSVLYSVRRVLWLSNCRPSPHCHPSPALIVVVVRPGRPCLRCGAALLPPRFS